MSWSHTLAMETRPQSAPDFAAALESGGIVSESKNFTNTVYSTLRREDAKKGAVIALPERKWGLTERCDQAARRRATGQGTDVAEALEQAVPGAEGVSVVGTEEEAEAAAAASVRSQLDGATNGSQRPDEQSLPGASS